MVDATYPPTAIAPRAHDAPSFSDNPLVMLHQMAKDGATAQELAPLAELAMMLEKDRREAAWNNAMRDCQAEIPTIAPTKKNPDTRSWYAPIETIRPIIKPIYIRHGFSLCHGSADSPLPNHYRWTCDVSHVEGHCKRFFLDLPSDATGMKGGATKTAIQGACSSSTYGERYLECKIFSITISGLDVDGNAETISVAEAEDIEDMLDQNNLDKERFKKWAGVEKISQIASRNYKKTIDAIKERIAESKRDVGVRP